MEWIEGRVVENIHWTDNLFSLRIDAAIDSFIAGQFTSLALDINGERIARPYSILSAPGESPLEFYFYVATDGVLSSALSRLECGSAIWVRRQANGFFTLREVPAARDLWLLATGTGIAPYFSMLKTAEPWQRFENIALVHAVRGSADLQYGELSRLFGRQYGDRFHFQTFVSREQMPGSLPGRIPAALADGRLEAALGLDLDPSTSQLMLCGNPDMVNDTVEILKPRGFTKNRRRTPGHITVENYW